MTLDSQQNMLILKKDPSQNINQTLLQTVLSGNAPSISNTSMPLTHDYFKNVPPDGSVTHG